MSSPKRERQLWSTIAELNIFHILLVIYAVPIIIGLFIACAGFLVLAFADPGFAQFLLFTIILGMLLGLPEALK